MRSIGVVLFCTDARFLIPLLAALAFPLNKGDFYSQGCFFMLSLYTFSAKNRETQAHQSVSSVTDHTPGDQTSKRQLEDLPQVVVLACQSGTKLLAAQCVEQHVPTLPNNALPAPKQEQESLHVLLQ